MIDASTPDLRFYADLPAFTDFALVGEMGGYAEMPDDWVLLAADIVKSSEAIAQGRYKDVNMVGAAVISAVLNALGEVEAPYVFGGDGAMLVVPETYQERCEDALTGVRRLAREVMKLELRLAAFPVSALRARAAEAKVRKLQLSPGNNLAMFAGGALELADKLLKNVNAGEPFRIADKPHKTVANLEGLSCRWEPLKPQCGRIVSLMARGSRGPDDVQGLARILQDISAVLEGNISGPNPANAPVKRASLRFRFPPRGLMSEVRMLGGDQGRIRTFFLSLASSTAFAFSYVTGRRIGYFEPEKYMGELQKNTDFRKFDDTLRLVLDVSPEQALALEDYLERAYDRGELIYGAHVARSALMTCLVFNIEHGRHVHFVDGADGGFAVAASEFKRRQRARARRDAGDVGIGRR